MMLVASLLSRILFNVQISNSKAFRPGKTWSGWETMKKLSFPLCLQLVFTPVKILEVNIQKPNTADKAMRLMGR